MGTIISLPSRGQPWSPNERAILGQIHDALGGERIETEREHGITDEGDPWTVFFEVHEGDFVAHVARIGLTYLFIWADGTSVCASNLQRFVVVARRGSLHALRAEASA